MTTEEFVGIIKKVQTGDPRAAEKLYNAFFPKIYMAVWQILKDRNDSYDVAMDVFIKLCMYPDADGIRTHKWFVKVMAENAAKDFLRTRKRLAGLSEYENRITVQMQETLWITDIVQELTDDEAEILISHAIWDEKFSVIAEKKGVSVITVKRTYKRVKAKIRTLYQN